MTRIFQKLIKASPCSAVELCLIEKSSFVVAICYGNFFHEHYYWKWEFVYWWYSHRKKAPSNKTPALTKSINKDIWVIGTSNEPIMRGWKLKQNFQKNKVATGKIPFFVIDASCTPHSIYLKIAGMAVLYGNNVFSILVTPIRKPSPSFLKRFSLSRKFISKLKR